MAFVNYIYFFSTLYWGKLGFFDEFSDVVYAGVAGGVDFDDV